MYRSQRWYVTVRYAHATSTAYRHRAAIAQVWSRTVAPNTLQKASCGARQAAPDVRRCHSIMF